MRNKRVLIIIGGVIVLVAITLAGYGCASGFGATRVKTVSVERQQVVDNYTEDGTISFGDSYSVISEVSGTVDEVLVSANQQVKAGDVLYRVGTSDYSYQLSVLEAQKSGYEAKLSQAKVSKVMTQTPEEYISTLKKQKESAAANLESATATYEANLSLYEAGDVSKTTFESIKAEYEAAQAAYQEASSRYTESSKYLKELEDEGMSREDIQEAFYGSDTNSIQASLDSTNAEIDHLKEQIEKCTVTAQKDGIISSLPVKNMSVVSVGQETAVLKTAAHPKVESDVLTSIAPYLKVGSEVSVKLSLRGKDEVYGGVISEIYDYADKGTSALGTDEYRVHVVMELKNAEGDVAGIKTEDDVAGTRSEGGAARTKSESGSVVRTQVSHENGSGAINDKLKSREGYGVNVTFSLYEADDALVIPTSAVFDSDNKDYVYVIEDNSINGGKAVKKEIEVEYETASLVVLKSGLSEGDVIIDQVDSDDIYDGARVKA